MCIYEERSQEICYFFQSLESGHKRDMLFVASFVKVPAAGRREDTNTATYSSMLAQGLQYGRRI